MAADAVDCGFPLLRKPYTASALRATIQDCLQRTRLAEPA
jgi:hypothetical protein